MARPETEPQTAAATRPCPDPEHLVDSPHGLKYNRSIHLRLSAALLETVMRSGFQMRLGRRLRRRDQGRLAPMLGARPVQGGQAMTQFYRAYEFGAAKGIAGSPRFLGANAKAHQGHIWRRDHRQLYQCPNHVRDAAPASLLLPHGRCADGPAGEDRPLHPLTHQGRRSVLERQGWRSRGGQRRLALPRAAGW